MSNQPLSSSISEADETAEGDDEEGEEEEEEELPPPMVGVGVRLQSQRGNEWGCSWHGSQFMDMGQHDSEDDDLGAEEVDAGPMEFL